TAHRSSPATYCSKRQRLGSGKRGSGEARSRSAPLLSSQGASENGRKRARVRAHSQPGTNPLVSATGSSAPVNARTVGARGGRAPAALLAVVLAATLAAAVATPSQRDLSAYPGLGTWLDLYAASAWANPEDAVAAMRANGVGTLFLETGKPFES